MIDISKLDKAEVLAALFNASRQQGMGFLDERGRRLMTKDQAQEILKEVADFDYLYGRVMKVNLEGPEFDPRWYDRDNGSGAAARALSKLQKAISA